MTDEPTAPTTISVYTGQRRVNVALAPAWRSPEQPAGGQCVALDENGDECAAFFHDGRWYLCTNQAAPHNEFQPQAWRPLPHAWSTT